MAAAYGSKDLRQPTGDATNRLLIPRKQLQYDPRALSLLDTNITIQWLGPRAHVVAYPIEKSQLYNVVLVHPEKPQARNVES